MFLSIFNFICVGTVVVSSQIIFELEPQFQALGLHNDKSKKSSDCFITAKENCPLSEMEVGETYRVFPGGSTSCINFSDYFFTVTRGSTGKLLYYFQGGGFCFAADLLENGYCFSNATANPTSGIFNLSNPSNPFIDYTIITTSYCSGDMHLGNVASSFKNVNNVPVKQLGVQNANSVLSWTLKQQSKKLIKNTLDDLVIAGSSAGALGLQIWSGKILSSLKSLNSAVLFDAGVDVAPSAYEGSQLEAYNICNDATLIPVKFKSKCKLSQLTAKDVFIDTMAKYPLTVFAYIQSMADPTLTKFYNVVVLYYGTEYGLSFISTSGFGILANATMSVLNKSPNFVSYLIVPSHHIFLSSSLLYTTTSSNLYGSTLDPTGLLPWLSLLPLETGYTISTTCSGIYCKYPLYPKDVQTLTFTPTKSPSFRGKPAPVKKAKKST